MQWSWHYRTVGRLISCPMLVLCGKGLGWFKVPSIFCSLDFTFSYPVSYLSISANCPSSVCPSLAFSTSPFVPVCVGCWAGQSWCGWRKFAGKSDVCGCPPMCTLATRILLFMSQRRSWLLWESESVNEKMTLKLSFECACVYLLVREWASKWMSKWVIG